MTGCSCAPTRMVRCQGFAWVISVDLSILVLELTGMWLLRLPVLGLNAAMTAEQLILHLVFSEQVKLHSINLVAPEPGQSAQRLVRADAECR